MKVFLEYVAMLRVEGATNGAALDVPENATVGDLLTQLGIRPEHQRVIVPFIGNERVNRTAVLREGDRVFLSMPVGGGCAHGGAEVNARCAQGNEGNGDALSEASFGTAHSAVAATFGILRKSAVATPLCGVASEWETYFR